MIWVSLPSLSICSDDLLLYMQWRSGVPCSPNLHVIMIWSSVPALNIYKQWWSEVPCPNYVYSVIWNTLFSLTTCSNDLEFLVRSIYVQWWLTVRAVTLDIQYSEVPCSPYLHVAMIWSPMLYIHSFTHLALDKMAATLADDILKRILLNEKHEFLLKFHWSLFLRIELIQFQHWFR